MSLYVPIWTNKETRLWLFQPGEGHAGVSFDYGQDQVTFLTHVSVREIQEGLQDDNLHWECGYCGQVNEGYAGCSRCPAPRLSRLRQAVLILEGALPHALCLAELNRHFGLEIVRQDCGRPDMYSPENVIMRFMSCRVTGRWIEDPVIVWAEDAKAMTICARVACRFFMRINGEFSPVVSEKEH